MKWPLLLLLCPISASAHDMDCKGAPVPMDIKADCCGPADAHSVSMSQVYEDEQGVWHYLIDGMDKPIVQHGSAIQPLPSPNGCAYVWYRRNDPATGMFEADPKKGTGPNFSFYCLQLPMAF